MTVDGDEVKEVECYKYLGSFVQRTGVLTRMWNIGLGVWVDQVEQSVWSLVR